MKIDNLIEGIEILRRYSGIEYPISAEHDIVYFCSTVRPIPEPDLSRLYELGWFQPEVEEGEEGEHGPYDPSEHWGAYV